jgi:serine/threonine-protein kinase HipA
MSEPERQRLAVYLGQERIGELERQGPARYRFTYDGGVVEQRGEGAIVLSASLPARAETYPNGLTRPFFEGLLPEGVARREIARMLGVSEANGFGLLGQLGSDCAGAVVVLPAETAPGTGRGEIRWLSEQELEERLRDLPRRPLGVMPEEGIRLSLGGVQHKLIVVRAPDGQIGQPVDGTPSTHIIKPGLEAYRDIVVNEAFCLQVASRTGLEAARAEIRTFGTMETLVVERFDRTLSGAASIVRLHQEDLCQALGVLPEAKYENEGGPSIATISELLREIGTARDLRWFSQAVLLNFLLGNSDAHAKNYALLYDQPSRVRLAPLYDIVSTAVYPALTTRLAMSIAGIDDPAAVDLAAWQSMLNEAGFRPQPEQLAREAEAVLESARTTRTAAQAEGWYRPVLDEIVAVAETRTAQLAR